MAILPAQALRRIRPVDPFYERTSHMGMTYGCGPAGYDVRIAETVKVKAHELCLASTIERFVMPNDVLAVVHDKSTWARLGILVQNTVIEPGWYGYLTLELSYHPIRRRYWSSDLIVMAGSPIAQIVFHRLEEATDSPYLGRYQDQRAGPQEAILMEGDSE